MMLAFNLNAPTLSLYEWSDRPIIGTTATTNPNNPTQTTPSQAIRLGGFSGLFYEGTTPTGNLKFITHTDRGPNGEPTDILPDVPGNERPFALPNFQPELVRFELDRQTGNITITQRIGLQRPDGSALTGLPNLQNGANGTAYTDEVPVDLFGNRLANDPLGADLEGIVVAQDGTFWLVDEYRPAIYHFNAQGRLLDRFIPTGTATTEGRFGTPALPAVYAHRRNNRGFEAIALEGTKLYAFIQSAIDNPDNAADTVSRNSRNLRILEFDTVTQQVTGEYLYLLNDISGSGNAKTDKIGDAVALGDGKFLVVERDDRSSVNANKLIYEIDLSRATRMNGTVVAGVSLPLTEAQEVPPVTDTPATGTFNAVLNGNVLEVTGSYMSLSSPLRPVGPAADVEGNPQSAGHIHLGNTGTNGPIARALRITETATGSGSFQGRFTLTAAEVEAAQREGLYVNLHTQSNPSGELRGQITLKQTLEQLSESELRSLDLQPVSKELVINAAQIGYTGVEKLEGLALIDDSKIALLNDNDFNLKPSPIKGDGTVQLNAEPTPVRLGILEPQPQTTIRFSQFNASLNRNREGDLVRDLSTPDNTQAKTVAEIIQRNRPDVLLLNEFDYVGANPLEAVNLFRENYLAVSQNGATPIDYPYIYIAPSNTGIPSGFDLDNDGNVVTTPGAPGYGNDAFGFGNFPGQFGMLLLSKYPIETENVRTFQTFRWQDMPDSLLPSIATPGSNQPWYSAEEQAVLRLSSKSHWDVPLLINGETVHVLASHPTPPTFDGPEDRNGKRNHDEIRFWADYVTPNAGGYIYDDIGRRGGLTPGSKFVIMGDQNADPVDGDSFDNAIRQLLNNPNVNANFMPTSLGAVQQAELQGGANRNQSGNPAFDTADFSDMAPGNLRTDYVLPSNNLEIQNAAVFWTPNTDPRFSLVGTFNPQLPGGFPSSDHRLVWTDINLTPQPNRSIANLKFDGQSIVPTGFIPTGNAGSVDGKETAVGGLSGITYDARTNQYYAISDDRSQNAPARFYTLTVDLRTGSLSDTGITFTDVTPLRDPAGKFFATNSLDPEGIVLTRRGTVFVSSEGEANPTAGRVTSPFINEFSLETGEQVRSLPIPRKFVPVFADTNQNGVTDAGDTQTAGVRNNLAFESLTITPNQRFLFTATESALFQDGAIATRTIGSRSRIIQYNLVTGQPEREYLYLTDTIAADPATATGFSDNGLVDLLAIDDRGTFLALERSFAQGVGNTIRLYEVSLQGATDISFNDSLSSLTPAQFTAIRPVQKRLLLNLNDLELPGGTDNIEGITFGPLLPDGRRSILLVSDNNFSTTQFTQILALEVDIVPAAAPTIETRPDLFDDPELPRDQRADADDPAVYINAQDASQSLVLTVAKNAGLRVYDLSGNLLQEVNPGGIRYNNIDLQYGFQLGGQAIDFAIATDRNNDKLVIFKINPDGANGQYVEDITDSAIGTIFQSTPFQPPYSASSRSAYGIALYRSPVSDEYYVFVNRRETGDVAQYRLFDAGNGKMGAMQIRNFTVPTVDDRDPQLEGMVVDQETGILYIGQENVGIWKYAAEPNGSNEGVLIDRVVDLGGQYLTDDVEGLTIYYGADGKGYLLASSQGDNTFVAYTREGNNEFVGRFAIDANGAIDSVQESDGAEVINLPLGPNFPKGVFITQDGSNEPARIAEDENVNTNFKYVPWENIANLFDRPLTIDTTSYNPRNPVNRLTLPNQVAKLNRNPREVTRRTPAIVSQFEVNPTGVQPSRQRHVQTSQPQDTLLAGGILNVGENGGRVRVISELAGGFEGRSALEPIGVGQSSIDQPSILVSPNWSLVMQTLESSSF